MEGEKRFSEARAERRHRLGNSPFGSGYFGRIAAEEIVHRLFFGQTADGRENPERIGVAMMGVGITAAIYEACMKYVQERNAFGGPIGRFQILQNYLADMYINLENSRNLTYKAAWLCDNGKPYHLEATMAKLVAAEAARRLAQGRWMARMIPSIARPIIT